VRTLLIACELVATPPNSVDHVDLIERIQQFSGWVHVHESLWLIRTDMTADAVKRALKEHLQARDRLLVVVLAGEAVWQRPLCDARALRAMF
jgi:hypothetical protein